MYRQSKTVSRDKYDLLKEKAQGWKDKANNYRYRIDKLERENEALTRENENLLEEIERLSDENRRLNEQRKYTRNSEIRNGGSRTGISELEELQEALENIKTKYQKLQLRLSATENGIRHKLMQ